MGIEEVGFEKMKKCLTCKYSITIIIVLRNNIFRLSASFRVCSGTGYEKQRIFYIKSFLRHAQILNNVIWIQGILRIAQMKCFPRLQCNPIQNVLTMMETHAHILLHILHHPFRNRSFGE